MSYVFYSSKTRRARSDVFTVKIKCCLLDASEWQGILTLVGTNKNNVEIADVFVKPGSRRKGIASAMYKKAVQLGYKLQPSDTITQEAVLLWKSLGYKGALTANYIYDVKPDI